jgi:chromosome segregation ATPase
LDTLEQVWQKAAAGINRVFGFHGNARPRLEALQRELISLAQAQHTLAAQLEQQRVDFERHGAGNSSKIDTLEQAHRQAETARIADERRLAELEQLLVGIEAGYRLAHDRIKALGASMEEATDRLETRCNQLKFLQDASSERFQTLKTTIAEAASRLETSDNDLRQVQDTAHERISALENALAETARRIESTERAFQDLQEHAIEQARQFSATLSATTARLDTTDSHVESLEKQSGSEHALQKLIFQETQEQVARQQERMSRLMVSAVLILVLVAMAVAILVTR